MTRDATFLSVQNGILLGSDGGEGLARALIARPGAGVAPLGWFVHLGGFLGASTSTVLLPEQQQLGVSCWNLCEQPGALLVPDSPLQGVLKHNSTFLSSFLRPPPRPQVNPDCIFLVGNQR